MFNKKHTIATKLKMSSTKSKTPIGLNDLDNKVIKVFNNQVELAKILNVHKSTISRHLKSGKLFLNKYYIKKI